MNLSFGSPMFAVPALALVLGLIWLTGQIARRLGLNHRDATASSGRARLRIVETLRVDAKRQLLLLCCDGREALVLTGGGQDVVVGWMPTADPPT